MSPTEKDLLNKLIETFNLWNKDLQNARNEFKNSIQSIDEARVLIENQKKSTSQIGLAYAPWIIIVLVLILITSLIVTFQCGTFTYQNFSYTRPC